MFSVANETHSEWSVARTNITFSMLISVLWTLLCFNWDFNVCAGAWLFLPTCCAKDHFKGAALATEETS